MKVKRNPIYQPPSMYWDFVDKVMVEYEDFHDHSYYDFDADKEYFVLGFNFFQNKDPTQNNFRLMGEIRCLIEKPLIYYLAPYLYEVKMFVITDEAIPDDWVVWFEPEMFYPVRSFGIYTYSDLVQYAKENKKSCYLHSHLIRQYDWDKFFDDNLEVRARIGPYLEQVYQEQLAWNQAPKP